MQNGLLQEVTIKAIARIVERRLVNYLRQPNVRYQYLTRLGEVICYDRKETMLHTCLEYVDIARVARDYV
jgi:hypothetical protein